ncbi:MAG: CPBP family intramembrane metalloprotease [Deltaproteobacteria bacterium]|nr:MAG: CPBP family intramembrane metalloprotease [Deltaproteobacteria bacterium]
MSPLRTALTAFAAAMAAVIALAQVARAVPWVAANLGALVALVFLAIPFRVAAVRRVDMADFGFTLDPIGRGIAFGAGFVAVVVPLFSLGFVAFYDAVCAPDAPGWLASLAMPGFCRSWHGWSGARIPSLGLGAVEAAFVQVVVVAIPEELFFRGFLHELCERRWPPRRRVLGGGVGLALIVSSALFAVGHLAVAFDPRRLAVFFPGLAFGWLRSATGSILAGVIAHTASNLLIDALTAVFF